jgi:Hydrazine synthase alpha subunit middle domain
MKQRKPVRRTVTGAVILTCLAVAPPLPAQQPQLTNPVLYVTQVKPSRPHRTVTSIEGSHLASADAAPRGGDLMILYPNRTQKNLTRIAGYGVDSPYQTGNAIAVRDPHVHWSGTRALFSMVVGGAFNPEPDAYHWQLYEITGLGAAETPVITIVPGQPADFNNIQPAYLSDGGIVFVSDRTRDGTKHLYPAIDEQGSAPANTGLWKLRDGALTLLEHSPSGSFEPMVDSYGRILFSRWDHLQRDSRTTAGVVTPSGAFDYASELPGAARTAGQFVDRFPEPLQSASDPLGLTFDLFMPWTVQQDGSDLVTLNHVGRHEFGIAFNRSRNDSNLADFTPSGVLPPNAGTGAPTRASSFLQISEHPFTKGRYLATDSVLTAISAGRLVMFNGQPTIPVNNMVPQVNSNTGFARDASWLADGKLIGSFIPGPPIQSTYGGDTGGGAIILPPLPPDQVPDGPSRIRLANSSIMLSNGVELTQGTPVTRTNYAPGGAATTYTGLLWELQPVEVRSRPQPPVVYEAAIPAPEASMFLAARVSPSKLKSWMSERNLALLSCRNVTSRDSADRQQPFNLRIPGGVSSSSGSGPVYDVTRVQFFQADYVRGYGLTDSPGDAPDPGRRALPVPLHEGYISAPPARNPDSSVQIAADGSMAAFVPAQRGVSWQLVTDNGDPVVRERYWLSFKAGEVRTCTSCHGVNQTDQLGRTVSTNAPAALQNLLAYWKSESPEERDATHYQVWSEMSAPAAAEPQADTDGDGHSNLAEYAYGSDPLTLPSTASVAVPLSAFVAREGAHRYPVVRFTCNTAANSRMVLESSGDLTNWTLAATTHSSGSCVPEPGYTSATRAIFAQVPNLVEYEVRGSAPLTAGTPRYFRMRVTAL